MTDARAVKKDQRGKRFFSGMAIVLLVVVIAGFGPSFYFRGSDAPELMLSVILHGAIMTVWYVLAVVQALLAKKGGGPAQLLLHRRLGMFGGLVALGVLVTGVMVAISLYRKDAADIVVPPPAILLANLTNVIGFAVCVVLGVKNRRVRDAHARYMSWASVVMIGPASFRLVRSLGLSPMFSVPAQLLFCAALVMHDRREFGRVHRASWLGLGIVFFQIVGSFTLGQTVVWEELARSLFAG